MCPVCMLFVGNVEAGAGADAVGFVRGAVEAGVDEGVAGGEPASAWNSHAAKDKSAMAVQNENSKRRRMSNLLDG